MCTKFQVDWTSASSKTTLIKNFNLGRDRRTNGRTDGRTDERTHRPENIMPLYYRRWGIKINRRNIFQNVKFINMSKREKNDKMRIFSVCTNTRYIV